MIVIKTAREMTEWSLSQRSRNKRIGFVPTMGYLHKGHLSLVDLARDEGRSDLIVMSIFVNPTQFGPNEDFSKYPRDFERDHVMAESVGVDVLFYPEASEIYEPNAKTMVEVEELGKVLCGVTRPTHFRGVTTVVAKLFSIVRPHVAIFGQKDAQQFFIIQRMTRDLFYDIELIRGPIRREEDGLAMSSRNVYLNSDERRQAVVVSESLKFAQEKISSGEKDAASVIMAMKKHIQSRTLANVDYVEIVNTTNLMPMRELTGEILIAVAVFFGKTRLIDNIIMKVS